MEVDPSKLVDYGLGAVALGVFVFFTLRLMKEWREDRRDILSQTFAMLTQQQEARTKAMDHGLAALTEMGDKQAEVLQQFAEKQTMALEKMAQANADRWDRFLDSQTEIIKLLALHDEANKSSLGQILGEIQARVRRRTGR